MKAEGQRLSYLLAVCRVEVLKLLRAIASEPCTLEAGRRWAVALIRQGGHAEYGRIPPYMVGVMWTP
jgi:hypothetical protein